MRKLVNLGRHDRGFLGVLTVCTVLAAACTPNPSVAMWVGFAFAAYSVVANDSIQTLGTFLASNQRHPWWLLWGFVGGVFLVTSYYSWEMYGGDVSYGRLASKGFEESPVSFSFLQLAAPLVLLVLTRQGIPVSTTFLILSSFAATGASIAQVLLKSLAGYVVAFVVAAGLWVALNRVLQHLRRGEPKPAWQTAQWASSGFLWSVWIMQDAANVAVYLPRSLSPGYFLVYCIVILAGLAILIRGRGGRIQEVVTEKYDVMDLRAATVINLVFGLILYWFKEISSIPMSTTWVFVGLLAGRELAVSLTGASGRSLREVFPLVMGDLAKVTLGLLVSVLLALVINPVVREALVGF